MNAHCPSRRGCHGLQREIPAGPGGQANFYVRINRRRLRSLGLASPEQDRRSVVIVVVVDSPVLGLSVGLPAPLGEADPSQEGGEPNHPCRHQEGPPPAPRIPIRKGQEKTEQHTGEHVCSPARRSTPARKYGPHAHRRSTRRHPRLHAPPARKAGGVSEVSLYARVTGIRRSRATRRRSRRAANLSTARRAARTTRPIMMNRPLHTACPRHIPWFCWNLADRAIFPLSRGLPTMGFAMTFFGRGSRDRRRHLRPQAQRIKKPFMRYAIVDEVCSTRAARSGRPTRRAK
jgi:hypothetical protein